MTARQQATAARIDTPVLVQITDWKWCLLNAKQLLLARAGSEQFPVALPNPSMLSDGCKEGQNQQH